MPSLSVRLSWLPARLRELLAHYDIPGGAVAVIQDGELTEAAAGLANIRAGVTATSDTLFLIGSITKVYTTTLVMQLVEQGQLDLDQPVATYVPDLQLGTPETSAQVTVRQLLAHTNGIPGDYLPDFGRGDEAVARYVESLASIGRLHPPGAFFSYSNSGFILAGRLLEVLTGMTWHQLIRQRLLEPAGLNDTVTLAENALPYRVGVGHIPDANGRLVVGQMWPEFHAGAPAGFTPFATARDVVRFAQIHLEHGVAANGKRILAPESVKAMQSSQGVLVPSGSFDSAGRGLGWALSRYDGNEPVLGHNGGSCATFRVLPERNFAVAMLTNSPAGTTAAHYLIDDIVDALFGLHVRTAPESSRRLTEMELRAFPGRYQHLDSLVEIEAVDGELVLVTPAGEGGQPARRTQLRPLELGSFELGSFATITPPDIPASLVSFIQPGMDGKPAYFHYAGRAMCRIE